MDEGAAAEAAAAAESQAIKDDNGRRCAAAGAIDELGEQTRFYASNAAKSMDLPWEQVR